VNHFAEINMILYECGSQSELRETQPDRFNTLEEQLCLFVVTSQDRDI